jgi:hypothetical protein
MLEKTGFRTFTTPKSKTYDKLPEKKTRKMED